MRLTILLLFLATQANAAIQKTGLKDAMAKGLVSVTATASGASYKAKGLHLEVKNRTNDALQLKIEPALIFRPADTSMQDLLLPDEELIVVAPAGSTGVDVQSFCAKSYAGSPRKDMVYSYFKTGDSILVALSQFLHRNGLYDFLGQEAVWAVTNYHSLDGINDDDRPEVTKRLLVFMAKLTSYPIPQYHKVYTMNDVPGLPAQPPHVLSIITNIEWRLDEPKKISLGIYNAAGILVQPVLDEKEMKKGGYKIRVEFEARAASAGKYFIRLMQNGVMKKEQVIVVD